MEYTIENLIDGLTYAQLLKLQFDLQHGALQLRKLIECRVKMLETQNRKICASCGSEILTDADSTYTLVFGASDFRKKATCCGIDCFEQFMEKLKQYEGTKPNVNTLSNRAATGQ